MGGNKACCISRGAPSPDGIPPRPIAIAADSEDPEARISADKPPVLSWPSRYSQPEDLADLNAIFDEAVDASDSEGKASIISSRISQVRIKLRKHLSRDSDFSKRASRSSQGNSDESAARREELKRIQKKRIQEELRNSEEYDEDARSLGLSALDLSSRRVTGNSVITTKEVTVVASPVNSLSRRHSFSIADRTPIAQDNELNVPLRRRSSVPDMPPEPTLKPQKLPSIADSLPKRSSWRLSFSSSRRASELRALSQDHTAAQTIVAEKTVIIEIEPIDDETDHVHLRGGQYTTTLVQPGTPVTATNYLKWLRGQGLRLPSPSASPSAEAKKSHKHVDVPGAHSSGSTSPEPPSFGGVDGQQEQPPSSFATRLHHLHISSRLASSTKGPLSQASSSRQPSVTSNLTSEENFQSITTRVSRRGRYASSELTAVKIPKSWDEVLHEQQDGASSFYLSDRNASQTTTTPTRQTRHSMPTSSEMYGSGDTTTELLGMQFVPTTASKWGLTSRLVPVPAVALTQAGEVTPVTLVKEQRPSAQRSPSKKFQRRSESDVTIRATLLGTSRNFLSGVWNNKKEPPPPEQVVSEPSSPDGPLGRRKTSSVVKSAFVEEFDEIDKPVRKSSSRSSFLSAIGLPRLNKLSTRSYDGSLDHSNTVPKRKPPGFKIDLPKPGASPTRSVSQKAPGTPSLFKATEMDSTEVMWHRAIRASIDARAMGIRKEFELIQPSPMTRPNMAFPKLPRKAGDHGLEDITDDSEDDADETTHLSREHSRKHSTHQPGNHVHTLQVPRINYDRVGSTTIAFAQNALTEQLAIQGSLGPQRIGIHGSHSPISQHAPDSPNKQSSAAQSTEDLPRNARVSFTRRATPPEAWARFPSHDRDQRCASAGTADKVALTDFATVVLDDGTEVFVQGQRKHLHHHHEKELGHKHHASLPDRITMKIRTSLDRLRIKQSTVNNEVFPGRRSSTSAGGQLMEPELELLPSLDITEMTETKLVEIEADEMMRRKERESRMVGRLPAPHGSDGMEDQAQASTSKDASQKSQIVHGVPVIGQASFYDDEIEDSRARAYSMRSAATYDEYVDFGSGDMMSDEERVMSKKSKFGTWSGKDKRKIDKGKMVERMEERELRKSTVDFEVQARLMEKAERDRLLNAVEGLMCKSESGVVKEIWREV